MAGRKNIKRAVNVSLSRNWLIPLAASALLCLALSTHLLKAEADDFSSVRPQVYFAGFGFLGEHAFIQANYPHSYILAQNESGPSQIDRALSHGLRDLRPASIDLMLSELGELKQGKSLSVALVLDRETISSEIINGYHKLLIEIGAQAMYFDFESMSIIGTFPINIEYVDAKKRPFTEDEISLIIKNIYLGELNVNLLKTFYEHLSNVEIQPKYKNRLQVTDVVIEDKALSFLPAHYNSNPQNIKSFIAQSFSKYLSDNQKIAVLPYTKGHAIGNKMSGRFSNGDVFQLTVPEPDFEVQLRLRGFKKVKYNENATGTAWIYASFLGLTLTEPLSQKVYTNLNLKNGATKVIPAVQSASEDWPAFQHSLLLLFDSFTKEISSPSRKWADKHSGDRDNISEIEEFGRIVQKCR